jgi:hypothetical protein
MVNQKYDLVKHSCKNTIKLVSRRLKKFIEMNDKIPNSNAILTHFHSKNVAPISIESYLNRILKYTLCGNECFLSVLVYFHRMSQIQNYIPSFPSSCKRNKKPFIINSYNIHRLLIAGITVSAKFNSDIFFLNSHYAKVGGLPINELNSLEMEFLMLNNYDLHVSVEELQYTGDCLLNNTLPEPVVVNGVKRMELLSQPVFFNKMINRFALTFEDTILIEKKNREEERKYGRIARLIKKSVFGKSKGSTNDRPLKYSKSYDLIRSSSKKKQLEEAYRYHAIHHMKPPISSNNQVPLPYQPPNSLPYASSNSNEKANDYIRDSSIRNNSIKNKNSYSLKDSISNSNSINSKSSHNTNLSYRHSTNSINIPGYQEKLELQNKLKGPSSHHESMLFISNDNFKDDRIPITTNKSGLSFSYSSESKQDIRKYTRRSTYEIDENVLKANFKACIDPNNQLSSKEMEKYQKAYNTYKEMYIKEVMLKNNNPRSSQVQVIPLDQTNKLAFDNNNSNLPSTSSSTNHVVKRASYKIKESSQQQPHYRQGLNPPQPNNHRISHLDLNQLKKNKSIKNPTDKTTKNIKTNKYNSEDNFELASPKPNNSYKNSLLQEEIIKHSSKSSKNSIESQSQFQSLSRSQSKSQSKSQLKSQSKSRSQYESEIQTQPNGEYEMKMYYNESFQNEDSILSSVNESSNYNITDSVSYDSSFLSEPSIIVKSNNGITVDDSTYPQQKENKDRNITSSSKEKRKSVHKRLSRNFNRILNNFNNISLDHSSQRKEKDIANTNNKQKEKEKDSVKEKETRKEVETDKDKNKNKENIPKARKGIKLMERKIKGLSHLLKQNKNDIKDDDEKVDKRDDNDTKDILKSSSKKEKEEKYVENSRKYYETLANILKHNKDNEDYFKKENFDNDVNQHNAKEVSTSKSYDTIDQLSDIYYSYTDSDQANVSHHLTSFSSNNIGNDGSSATFGNSREIKNTAKDLKDIKNIKETKDIKIIEDPKDIKDIKNIEDTNSFYTSEKYPKTISNVEKKDLILENNIIRNKKKISSHVTKSDSTSSDGISNHLGEFDDINDEHVKSFYHDLNEEKKGFNQYIYDFNKYYQNKEDSEEDHSLEEGDVEISSSTDIMNSFDLKGIDDKAYEENKTSYDFIKKTHSYTSTDIYSYYAHLSTSKNNDSVVEDNNSKNIKIKESPEFDLNKKELINKNIYEVNPHDHDEKNQKEQDSTFQKDLPLEVFESKNNDGNDREHEHKNINTIKNINENENENENINKNEIKKKLTYNKSSSDQMKKYTSHNTEEYENEIHDIKNFLEEQNETINADLSKFSNDEAENTNISSFATSIHSIYISSSQRDDNNLSSTSVKNSLFEDEENLQATVETINMDLSNKKNNKGSKETRSFISSSSSENLNLNENKKIENVKSETVKEVKENKEDKGDDNRITTIFSDYYNTQRLKDYYENDKVDEDENNNDLDDEDGNNIDDVDIDEKGNNKNSSSQRENINNILKNKDNGKHIEMENVKKYPKTEEITEMVSETIYHEQLSIEKPIKGEEREEEITYPITEERTEDILKRNH